MNIILDFDSAAAAAPTGFEAAIQDAANVIDAELTNPITVTIGIDYTNTGADLAYAGPNQWGTLTYSQLVANLTAGNAAHPTAFDTTFLADLPGDPTNGGSYLVSQAQEKAWGLISPNTTEVDGSASFSNTFTWDYTGNGGPGYSLIGVAEHELTHALGRLTLNDAGSVATAMNLINYGPNGSLDLNTADPRYFSADGGKTDLAAFDSLSDPGDFTATNDAFNAGFAPARAYSWSTLDSELMNTLGFSVTKSYTTSFSLMLTNDANIQFSGTGDTGNIYQGNNDTITVTGTDQTVEFSITGTPAMTVVDHGSGLQLGIGETVAAINIDGFQNDPTAKVNLLLGTMIPSLAPDGNGGTMLTVQDGGQPGGTQADFIDDPNLTMNQITGGDTPPPPSPPPTPPPPTPPPSPLSVLDTTTGQAVNAVSQPYTGPVAGLQSQYINITSDNLNISVSTPNWFLHSGSGEDAIAANSGTNVLDGGTGSNFLTGGSGTDTFFVDDRAATADIWSTVVGFHAGDAATIWGVTPQDFSLTWVDGQGATGNTGLTLNATAAGQPTASLTLAGYTSADLSGGRLAVSFGTVGGSAYMYVHGNS